ncbi:hypothetical protein Ddye_006238 [Dipteronia dyeriana]|uniref:non-specific serine/threonine protein kinase n=1 Tax=Dipteronia dyeriana TaxID=168575 RepID=A0AAD9XI08_9ROSI|nr:hypothetical protein Ddye_006238 [Dipteronia dyeriana]
MLNLSHNNLFGLIPRNFEDKHSLSIVDISCNKLHGLIPNNNAFQDHSIEELQGNEGLCGNVSGLQHCNVPVSHRHGFTKARKIIFLIVFPLLRMLALLIGAVGILITFRRRKRDSVQDKPNNANNQEIFSALKFDGRIMHEDITMAGFYSHARYSYLVYKYIKRGSLTTILSNKGATV